MCTLICVYSTAQDRTIDTDASQRVHHRDTALEHGGRHKEVGDDGKAEEHLQYQSHAFWEGFEL